MNPQIERMAVGIEHKGKIIAAISVSYLFHYFNGKFRETNERIPQEEKNKIEGELSFSFPDLDAIY